MQSRPTEETVDHQIAPPALSGKSNNHLGPIFLNNPGTQPEPDILLRSEIGGFKVQWKNDGTDYPALWQAFIRGELSSTPLSHGRPFRETHLVETGGRSYLFKRDWHVEKRLEKRLWFLLMGATRYSRIIQLTNRAIRQGCQEVQDVFLVAEKMIGRTCHEAWFIADFMPGQVLPPQEEDYWREELIEAVLRIHDCDLACNDIQSYNFIRTDEGRIKGIDLDISSPLLICQVNDLLEIKRRFGVNPPLRNWPVRLLYYPLLIRNYVRYFSRKLRGRPDRYAKRQRAGTMADSANAGNGLSTKEENGWRIQWKTDGFDYPALLNDFRQGRQPFDSLSTGSPVREVYRVALADRRLVIKRDLEFDTRLEKRFWDRLGGTPYSRLIKFTNRAVNQGCQLVQDVYLVAEKIVDGRCREAWLIAEYVEGAAFIQEFIGGRPTKVIEYQTRIPEIVRTMGELHNWGLASNDFHIGNFVLTPQGELRVIDLEMDGPIIACQANDLLTLVHFFKIKPPISSLRLRLLYGLMTLWRWQKNATRSLRQKIKLVFRGKGDES